MMRLRNVAVIALATMLCVLLTTGCGSSSTSGTGSESGVTLSTSSGEAKGEISNLTWGLPNGEPVSLDPAQAVDYSGALVVSNLCDTLLGQKPDTTLEPNAATLKRVSPTKFVFTLKHGIHFWDGKEATAEDMLFSLEWTARPVSIATNTFEYVTSMKATGPDQVMVTLSRPDVVFEKELGSTLVTPLIEKKFTEEAGGTFGTAKGGLMCSGPFELGSWKPGESITLTRNEHYWNAERKAQAKTVTLKFLNDSTALAQALSSGEVEGAYGVPAAIIPRLSNAGNGNLFYGESQEYLTLSVATPESQLNEFKLLNALSHSLNRKAIAEAIYHGAAEANYTYLGRNSWPPDSKAAWQAAYPPHVKANEFNPELAKKRVEESKYDGQSLVMVIGAGDETTSQVAQLIQQEAAQAGLKFVIHTEQPTQFETASYTASARKGQDLIVSKSFNVIKNPLELFPITLKPGEYYNYTGYNNPVVAGKPTSLVERATETPNSSAQAKLLIQAQSMFENEGRRPGLTVNTVDTITFLDNKLAGANTGGTYMWTPSLATIGSAE